VIREKNKLNGSVSFNKYQTRNDVEVLIERIELKLSRKNILRFEILTEADKNFQLKFDKLIEKLVGYKMDTRWLHVIKVRSAGSEFAFMIANKEISVHARVIFANGDINVPHFRFITTKKNL
jgi:hypothetical protein